MKTTKQTTKQTMPASDARPLGTKSPKLSRAKHSKSTKSTPKSRRASFDALPTDSEETITAAKKTVDSTESRAVSSPHDDATRNALTSGNDAHSRSTDMNTVTGTLSTKTRKSTLVVYTLDGHGQKSVRVPKTLFPDGKPFATLTLTAPEGEAFAEAKQPKAKMSAEERKAARAAAPKLTLEQKVAKAEARAAKLREKLASVQPSA